CVGLNRARGDYPLLTINLANLGFAARARGDYSSALALFEESLALVRDTGDQQLRAEMLIGLGKVLCDQGNLSAPTARLTQAITICKETGDPYGTAKAMEAFGELSMATNAPIPAARIWGAAERLRQELASPMGLDGQAQYNAAVAAARVALGDEAFETEWREG